MSWQDYTIATSRTHHLIRGSEVYTERFDEVLAFHSPGLAPVRKKTYAWHIDPQGKAAYSKRFRRTFGFYEGLAAVINEDAWYHIKPDGTGAYADRYSWCGNFQNGYCTVRDIEGRYFHITPEGTAAYAERWYYAGDFRDGIGVIQDENGYSTHIETSGQPLHGRWFLDLDVFHKGFARARDESGWMHIDMNGKPIYDRRFAAIEPFYNGQARVERIDGGLEIIDESGHVVVEIRPALQSEFAVLSADMVGFWRTQTIASAVELGLFEVLPGTAGRVAKACALKLDRAQRMLRGLAELSLVKKDTERWYLTTRGEYLLAHHPMTLSDAAREYGHCFAKMWQTLPDAIRKEGKWQTPEIFNDIADDVVRRKAHHRMLRSYALHDYSAVPETMALKGNERIVDAGGGTGVLASSLAAHYPKAHVVLLERPEIIDLAVSSNILSERIEVRAADLFKPWCIDVDVVVLSRVLHDWNDNDALRILHHARSSLSSGGYVFIIEMLLSEHNVDGSLCDLHLLMATGGQERTVSEYSSLMESSGFELVDVRQLLKIPSVIVGVAR